jgi:hypothetical protein
MGQRKRTTKYIKISSQIQYQMVNISGYANEMQSLLIIHTITTTRYSLGLLADHSPIPDLNANQHTDF